MWENFTLSFLYSLFKDTFGWIGRKRRSNRKAPQEILAAQAKFKPIFGDIVLKNWRDKLRREIVIRDVARLSAYPEVDEKVKGISPWFRVSLLDTYHRGILVGLQWERIVSEGNGQYRVAREGDDMERAIKVILAGRIPYVNIESVDLVGDEYYYFPHVYCHFTSKKSPYEDLAYYEERQNPGGPPFYTEIADERDVSTPFRKRKWYKFGFGR